jgi:hypothetical protein
MHSAWIRAASTYYITVAVIATFYNVEIILAAAIVFSPFNATAVIAP